MGGVLCVGRVWKRRAPIRERHEMSDQDDKTLSHLGRDLCGLIFHTDTRGDVAAFRLETGDP